MKSRHIIAIIVSGFFLASCAPPLTVPPSPPPPPPPKTLKSFNVNLQVNPLNTKLLNQGPNHGCTRAASGCVRVGKPHNGEIVFKITNSGPLPCSHSGAANSWYIDKIELADFAGDFGESVSPWIVGDFGATEANGLVWQQGSDPESDTHTLDDANKHKGTAHYLVTAKSCDITKGPINTDPRIENEGVMN